MNKDIDKLQALLKTDEAGEEIASILNELLVDDKKKNVLIVKLQDIRKEMLRLSMEVRLTKSEQVARSLALGSSKPLTAQEVSQMGASELKSLKHVSHASAVLNSLVNKGVLGKFKFGYNYYFTNPREAVNEQLKRREETPEDCSPSEIAEETGMPLAVVLDSIEELIN